MLIGAALVGVYMMLFGGSGDPAGKVLDRMENRIGEVVRDTTRRTGALAVVGELRTTRQGTFKSIESLSERLSKSHANHVAPRLETEKLLEELDPIWNEALKKQLDARFKLREILTRDEWAQVFPAPRQ